MSRPIVNVPLTHSSDFEAMEVELGFGGYGVSLCYISIRGVRRFTVMLAPDRARLLGRALIHAAEASDAHAGVRYGTGGNT